MNKALKDWSLRMRYLPLTSHDRQAMFDKIGIGDINDLFEGLPNIHENSLNLPLHQTEIDVERIMSRYEGLNQSAKDGPFFLGAGCYHHHIPSTVDYLIQRSEFMTSYTPYQPELAQGTLQAIFEFQTIIAMLTGMDVANASMYDGATACAEAALMARRITGRKKIMIANTLHPHYKAVLETYIGKESVLENTSQPHEDLAAIIIQSPDFHGTPHDLNNWRDLCDRLGIKLIFVTNEIISLGILPAPVNADIVCGEAQSIGIPMSFGGPHLGFFACKQEYIRQMPGRLCGETVDSKGRPSYVLTLSTREQHIRREKATSNICTNQGLCALAFTVHMALLGEEGFKHLAHLNHQKACLLADSLSKIKGIKIINTHFFNEFIIELDESFPKAADIIEQLSQKKIIAGLAISAHHILICATEMTTEADIFALTEQLYCISLSQPV